MARAVIGGVCVVVVGPEVLPPEPTQDSTETGEPTYTDAQTDIMQLWFEDDLMDRPTIYALISAIELAGKLRNETQPNYSDVAPDRGVDLLWESGERHLHIHTPPHSSHQSYIYWKEDGHRSDIVKDVDLNSDDTLQFIRQRLEWLTHEVPARPRS